MAKLIYQAGFESEALDAAGGDSADTLGPMQLTQGPEVPGSAIDKLTMLASPPRAQFTLTRAKDFPVNDLKTNCYVGAVVYPFSWNVPYFKVRATFELPDWQSTATKFGWAAAVFYRKGDADYWPRDDERATITMRSALANGVLQSYLNMPGRSNNVPAVVIPPEVFGELYSADSQRSTFTLEMIVDRARFAQARARLEAHGSGPTGHYDVARWFKHALLTEETEARRPRPTIPDSRPTPDPRDSVGFALAIASCDQKGTASITISDFRIYELSLMELLFRKIADWLSSLLPGRR